MNRPPQIIGYGPFDVDESDDFTVGVINIAVEVRDPDLPANTTTLSLVSGPPGVTVSNDVNQGINWSPRETDGPGTYNVVVSG